MIYWYVASWKSEILRQAVVYYRVPLAIVMCLGCTLTGWLITKWHGAQHIPLVILSALAPLLWAIPWAWETVRLLYTGLWPFWDFRIALIFQAALLVAVYPLCILIGGLWVRADPEAA
jgi:hypothetical protein